MNELESAIFSFAESVLLRSLPVRDPDALVVMKWRAKGYALASSGMRPMVPRM